MQSLRGISICTGLKKPLDIKSIMQFVDTCGYYWLIEESGIYLNKYDREDHNKWYDADQLQQLLNSIFLNECAKITRYASFNPLQESPRDYKDFLQSECSFALLYWDCGYCDLFSKDINEIKRIYENLHGIVDECEYVYEHNDGRTVFSIM